MRATLLRQIAVERAHHGDHGLQRGAALARHLAADQVVRLDAGGTFVDRRDLRVAQVLSGTGFLDVAHAAMHLHADRGDGDARLGTPALDHRDHQIDEGLIAFAGFGVGVMHRRIVRSRDHVGQRPGRFGVGLHGHQHAAHVGMLDDRHFRPTAHADVGTLDAIARIVARPLISALAGRNAFQADAETRRVHHDEHVFQATVLLADQIADRSAVVAEGHDRRRAGVDAEFVFDRHAIGVVARAQAAVVVDQELRHDEQ